MSTRTDVRSFADSLSLILMASPSPSRLLMVLAFATSALQLSTLPSEANDAHRLWYFSSSLGLHTTEDEVRNNATMQEDPRPGQEDSRTAVIDDGLTLTLGAGFGLTERLALQLDVGWFRGDIGPVDGYLTHQYPAPANPFNPSALTATAQQASSLPSMAGTLTQIPVSLSLVGRFRKDTRLNPFIGAGGGMIFTDIKVDDELEALNARLARLRVREIYNEHETALTSEELFPLKAQGKLPPSHLLSVKTDDAFEWHLMAGLEYFFGSRSSFIATASYTFTDGAVTFLAAGEDQVSFWIYPEPLFRDDGSLKIFNDLGLFPNPYVNPGNPSLGLVKCTPNSVGDFDHDGHGDDLCYRNDSLTTRDDPEGRLLVQGGTIEFDGFTINLGLRFYF